MMEKTISFAGLSNDFPMELKKQVDAYFKSNKIKQTGNWKLYLKTAIMLSIFFASFYAVVFTETNIWVKFLISIIFGLNAAGIGMTVMHDGAHGSYSQTPWINNLMGHTLNLFGGSVYFWKIKHNVIHHNVTNIEGHDDDINLRPLMRTNEHQPFSKGHKYQHIYGVFLYCQTVLWWILVRDYIKHFTGKIASKDIGKIPAREHIIFWFTKLAFVAVYLVLPIFMVGLLQGLMFFFVYHFVMGLTLALVFQLAHVVENAEFPIPANQENKIEHDWFYHQFATTANFGTKSRFLCWFTGGLNFQVEHHLFPRISHVHYRSLQKIVKELCAKYKTPYNEFPTMWAGIVSHFRLLKKLGREEFPGVHNQSKHKNNPHEKEMELETA